MGIQLPHPRTGAVSQLYLFGCNLKTSPKTSLSLSFTTFRPYVPSAEPPPPPDRSPAGLTPTIWNPRQSVGRLYPGRRGLDHEVRCGGGLPGTTDRSSCQLQQLLSQLSERGSWRLGAATGRVGEQGGPGVGADSAQGRHREIELRIISKYQLEL